MILKSMRPKQRGLLRAVTVAGVSLAVTFLSWPVGAIGQNAASPVTKNAQVKTTSAGLATKVAPGDLLPVSVRLANFGGGRRVDVLVHYDMVEDATGKVVLSTNETVAVETTDNFVKNLQVPSGVSAGDYTVKASITYRGQQVPATTSFTFQVEPKIFGVFRNEFYIYGSGAIVVGIGLVIVGHQSDKRRRATRVTALDYGEIPRDKRVFYELVSDTVMSMRQQVGQQALDIAGGIEGLEIDEHTGRVIKLSGSPSRIVAELVSGYEKSLGKRVSFSFRREESNEQHGEPPVQRKDNVT